MSPALRPTRWPPGIVVGIGGHGLETYRIAVRLGAEEAALRQVPLRLVHGSRPTGPEGSAAATAMVSRQQRGRRLVNGAARDLAGSSLGRNIQILTESSPRTAVDLLLAHGRAAVMLVLQRGDGWDVPVGPTTRAVTAAAQCPTMVTRSAEHSARDAGVLVVLDPEHDPSLAIALAFTEASLRGGAVTVLDARVDVALARLVLGTAAAANPDVPVRYAAADRARPAEQLRELVRDAALLVMVRPEGVGTRRLTADAAEQATCPVLMVAAVTPGA